ncbi:MAG: hypothetical protein KKC80_03965 [Candidatus Margulisbacteria bacterium]|nr:hypothetical protein [Candidatus Margulisiibacteriota bacterium]MBU1616715.1 hypothetical protein [Candidatus Margulisiibacteriota bacterium]
MKLFKIAALLMILILLSGAAEARDLRAVKLKRFLDRYEFSPLRGHEQEIVYCADKFGIDYRLYVAIAGAESTYGKRFPATRKNLTGHRNGDTAFESIFDNIYQTSKLIGTRHYYRKYRQTKDIWDLVYVYKGVPPYDHYVRNLRYALDTITAVSVEDVKKEEAAWLAKINSPEYLAEVKRKFQAAALATWSALRYDRYATGKTSTVDIQKEAEKAPKIEQIKQNVFVAKDELRRADAF